MLGGRSCVTWDARIMPSSRLPYSFCLFDHTKRLENSSVFLGAKVKMLFILVVCLITQL